jgi:hypothetical protein
VGRLDAPANTRVPDGRLRASLQAGAPLDAPRLPFLRLARHPQTPAFLHDWCLQVADIFWSQRSCSRRTGVLPLRDDAG